MEILYRNILFVAGGMIVVATNALGQRTYPETTPISSLHHEVMEDPYLPNAHQNKKVSPGYKYSNALTPLQTTSSIFTIQVNVDSLGQNIIDDAANEPSIAVNPLNPNEMVIGWRQFDNIFSSFRQAGWAFTTDAGQSWTFPGVIEPGIFRSDPVLDFDANGNFYYNSLTNSPDFFCKVFESADGGATWNAGTDAQGGDKQWMAIDRTGGVGTGNVYSFWTSVYSTCPPGHFTRAVSGSNFYENCTVVDGDPALGTMAINNAGELFIGGTGIYFDSLTVAKSVNAQVAGSTIAWSMINVFMDGSLGYGGINPQGLLGQVNIDVDRSNGPGQDNIYIVGSITRSSTFDPADVMFSRSIDGGATWSPPEQINNDNSNINTQWFATMSVAPNGRIDIVWLDNRLDSTATDSSALFYSYSVDQGSTWSVNEVLSLKFDPYVGFPMQQKMGDYFDMQSDSIGVHLAWANTLNGEQDVYYSRIIPQIPIGISETPPGQFIEVFPNPTTGIFKIVNYQHVENQETELEIYNALGELIDTRFISSPQVEIDFSAKPPGIYFLEFKQQGENPFVKKLVRQ